MGEKSSKSINVDSTFIQETRVYTGRFTSLVPQCTTSTQCNRYQADGKMHNFFQFLVPTTMYRVILICSHIQLRVCSQFSYFKNLLTGKINSQSFGLPPEVEIPETEIGENGKIVKSQMEISRKTSGITSQLITEGLDPTLYTPVRESGNGNNNPN